MQFYNYFLNYAVLLLICRIRYNRPTFEPVTGIFFTGAFQSPRLQTDLPEAGDARGGRGVQEPGRRLLVRPDPQQRQDAPVVHWEVHSRQKLVLLIRMTQPPTLSDTQLERSSICLRD